MRVFKFGGASVKDANGVKNLVSVLEQVGHEHTLIVVSAMGKTTNALENVIEAYINDKSKFEEKLIDVINYHEAILDDLVGCKKPY